jgi:cation diffusion facilitator family transporter
MSGSIDQLNREKTGTARLSIFSNAGLVVLKLAAGFMIGSVSVISEAIHSGIDLVAALIAYYSVRKSSEPPDREHAFGHGKFENVSGAIEAVLIFAAALFIIREAYQKALHGTELENVNLGIGVMALSAIVNFAVSQKLMATAKRTESIALEADAWHLRTDVLTSLGIFAGLIAIKLTGWTILDPIFAVAVALFILKAALELTIRSLKDLLDVNLPDAEVEAIERTIGDHAGQYVGFHELRTRKSGSDRFIDLHLVVSRELNVEQAHGLADHIEEDIKARFPRASVIIHVEPCDNNDSCIECQARECSRNPALMEK